MGEVLDEDMKKLENVLMKKQKEFDDAVSISRDVIRYCAKAITMVHADNMEDAKRHIELAASGLKKVSAFDDFDYIVTQSYQEFVEARVFYEIKKNGTIPSYADLGVDAGPYMLGLMDVVGELKREMLGAMRKKDAKSARLYFSFMEKIYDSTRGLRFPEAILPGFRKKQDVARIQLENADSDMLRFSDK